MSTSHATLDEFRWLRGQHDQTRTALMDLLHAVSTSYGDSIHLSELTAEIWGRLEPRYSVKLDPPPPKGSTVRWQRIVAEDFPDEPGWAPPGQRKIPDEPPHGEWMAEEAFDGGWYVSRLGWGAVHLHIPNPDTLNLTLKTVAHILANALNREAAE